MFTLTLAGWLETSHAPSITAAVDSTIEFIQARIRGDHHAYKRSFRWEELRDRPGTADPDPAVYICALEAVRFPLPSRCAGPGLPKGKVSFTVEMPRGVRPAAFLAWTGSSDAIARVHEIERKWADEQAQAEAHQQAWAEQQAQVDREAQAEAGPENTAVGQGDAVRSRPSEDTMNSDRKNEAAGESISDRSSREEASDIRNGIVLSQKQKSFLTHLAGEQIARDSTVPARVFWTGPIPDVEELAASIPSEYIKTIDHGVEGESYKLTLRGFLESGRAREITEAIEDIAEVVRWYVRAEPDTQSYGWERVKQLLRTKGKDLHDAQVPLYITAARLARLGVDGRKDGNTLTLHVPGDLYLKDVVRWHSVRDVLATHDRWDAASRGTGDQNQQKVQETTANEGRDVEPDSASASFPSFDGESSRPAPPPSRPLPISALDTTGPLKTPSARRVVVLTALDVEFGAVRQLLSSVRREQHPSGTIYEVGRCKGWEVAVVEAGAGQSRASFETERAIQHFSPGLVVFLGVAGGIKDVSVGDVVVASKVYGYESGKDEAEFRPRPDGGEPSYPALQAARAVVRDMRRERSEFRVFIKPIAAGEKVVVSRESETAKLIHRIYGDTVAVEMEGRGFLLAASARVGVNFAVIRGISDLLDGKAASDAAGSQERASANAASVLARLLDGLGPVEASPDAGSADPLPWEYTMLYERIVSALDEHKADRKDLEFRIPGASRPTPPREDMVGIIGSELARLTVWVQTVEPLLNNLTVKALGPPGQPGDEAEIEYLASRIGRVYGEFIRWGNGWRAMGLAAEWNGVIEAFAAAGLSLARDVERFRDDMAKALDAVRNYDGGEKVTYAVTLEIRAPAGLDGVHEEAARVLGVELVE